MFKELRNLFCWHKPVVFADGSQKGHYDGMSQWSVCRKCGREICKTSQGWV
jgi:hypothetical protein